MNESPIVTVNIHGAPKVARTNSATGSLALLVDDVCYGSGVTFFCGDATLAAKIASAINAAIAEHAADVLLAMRPADEFSEATE